MEVVTETQSAVANGAAGHPTAMVAVLECADAMPLLGRQVSQVASDVEGAVTAVCAGFGAMAQRVQEGAERAAALLGQAGEEGRPNVNTLVATTRRTLETLLEHIVQSSYLSMKAYERMTVLEQGMLQIESVLERLDTLASDTRILAVNAAISAASAGGDGKRFGVFSREIRELARSSASMTHAIRDVIEGVRRDFVAMGGELKALASTDMSMTILAKDEIDSVLTVMSKANDEMRASVQDARIEAEGIGQDIAAAVMSLQFQDAVSQRLAHVAETLADMSEVLRHAAIPICSGEMQPSSVLERMTARYTMQSEHIGVGNEVACAQVAPPSDGCEIELF